MSTIVTKLLAEGMSYTTLAKICQMKVLDIKKARKDDSVLTPEALDKLQRLHRYYSIFSESNESPTIDPATFFEEQVYLCTDKHDNQCWAYVHELWMSGLMDDALLVSDTWSIKTFYGMDELLEDYPMEYNVVRMNDGMKSIVADIPLPKAEMENMYPLV